jgi:acyl-CoA hydrolase
MNIRTSPVTPADLNLPLHLRAGDRILVAQGAGEPEALVRALVDAATVVADLTACIGMLMGDVLTHASGLTFESYGALGHAARLQPESLVILPLHYSDYIARLCDGRLPVDVVFVRLSGANENGDHHLGMGDLHLIDVARRARLVIAEINVNTPRTYGTVWPRDVKIDHMVQSGTPDLELPQSAAGAVEDKIGQHVAQLVPDRAVLQIGVGRLPDAIIKHLRHHRDLGVHSGALTDAIVALLKTGVVTNAAKEIDAGISIGGAVIGSAGLFDHINDNAAVHIRPTSYTHSPMQIGQLSQFHAINSAIEIDLLGQINTETAIQRHIGGIGGQVDFTRGAQISSAGRAIVALPSTAQKGTKSRIVPHVETVSLARTDADTVVTEWGVAELRGVSAQVRAERLIAIADPQYRDDLSRAWHDRRQAC